jgi:hypothetical protein
MAHLVTTKQPCLTPGRTIMTRISSRKRAVLDAVAKKTLACALAMAIVWSLGIASAFATPITFVKATKDNIPAAPGQAATAANTTLANGSPLVLNTDYVATGADDEMWGYRATSLHTGSTTAYNVFFGSRDNGTNDENSPRLRTTISGLTVGETYDIYAYYFGSSSNSVTAGNQDYRIRAGLENTVGELPLFTQRGDNPAFPGSTQGFAVPHQGVNPNPLIIPEGLIINGVNTDPNPGTTFLIQNLIGQAVAVDDGNGSGQIWVYIDDDTSAVGSSSGIANQIVRSVYTGVGFALVPEPSGIFLVGSGLLGLVAHRRRRRRN